MTRWTHWLSVVAVAAVLGCSDSGGPDDDGDGGNGPPATGTVTVGNNFFNPSSVTVATNGTVTWNWNSNGVSHNVTFSTGSSSPTQSSGSFSRAFTAAGTYNYLCTVHGSAMSGTVVVQQSTSGNDPGY